MDGIGFVLKKIISRLCFPLGLSLILGLAGLVLWRLRRGSGKQLDDGPGLGRSAGLGAGQGAGLGWWLAAAGWALLLVFSLPLTSWLLLTPIERQAGDYADPAALAAQGVETIVVLGGGVHQGERTAYDRLKSGTTQRVFEAVRLWRQMPGARILLSGGSYEPGLAEAEVMAVLARDLGVPESALELETESWDTGEQAAMLAGRLGQEPFALVTSAFHMRRALALFKAQGLRPCPAPTDFGTKGSTYSYNTLLPQAGGLSASEAAIYEHMGWTWYRLKAWLGLGSGRDLPRGRPEAAR